MPLIEHDKAIDMYFAEVSEKYPNISYEKFVRICKAPFIFVRKIISHESFPIVLVKYLGRFTIFAGRIRTKLNENETYFSKKMIDEQTYLERKYRLEEYLKAIEVTKEGTDYELLDE